MANEIKLPTSQYSSSFMRLLKAALAYLQEQIDTKLANSGGAGVELANNLTRTTAGSALDGRQGPVIVQRLAGKSDSATVDTLADASDIEFDEVRQYTFVFVSNENTLYIKTASGITPFAVFE